MIHKCKICKYKTPSFNWFYIHVNVEHFLNKKEYYDLYLKRDGEDICEISGCENKTKFENTVKGYRRFCSRRCKSFV